MEGITELMQTGTFLLILFCINIALIVGFIINTINFSKRRAKHNF